MANKIKNTSFTDIGKEYDVDGNAIKKWCKTLNLPYKRFIINSIPNEIWDEVIENYSEYKDKYEKLEDEKNSKRSDENIIAMFEEGYSITWISKHCHRDNSHVKKVLLKQGYDIEYHPIETHIYCFDFNMLFISSKDIARYLVANKDAATNKNIKSVMSSVVRTASGKRKQYCGYRFSYLKNLPTNHPAHSMTPVKVDEDGNIVSS